jgi:hypothetical protein
MVTEVEVDVSDRLTVEDVFNHISQLMKQKKVEARTTANQG